MQVVSVKFNPWDQKTFDYFTTLDLKPGDEVVVETDRGEAVVRVETLNRNSDKARKWIVRKAP